VGGSFFVPGLFVGAGLGGFGFVDIILDIFLFIFPSQKLKIIYSS
jgi:hypothetical protein